ncbi:hypothetical protein V7S43_018034 [Phytophthora oleae]|uniref:RxLR effector protein n=1 Tax=Phytophthora oleae TaxID=2107226 RepID=A0ABD3ERM8_9STRA
MGNQVAQTLALPLVWAAFEQAHNRDKRFPKRLQERIVQPYQNAGGNPALNPVDREAFYVLGDGSQLNLVLINDEETGAANRGEGPMNSVSSGGAGTRREFAALHPQILSTRRYMTEVMDEVQRSRREAHAETQKMMAILRRIAAYPIHREARACQDSSLHAQCENGEDVIHRRNLPARLSKRPKDLYELWHEYHFGLSGLKLAKDFSLAKRGANKFAYSRRKPLWDVAANLVRAGFTCDAAIAKIYSMCGRQLSVTSILIGLRDDRKRGGLRVLAL